MADSLYKEGAGTLNEQDVHKGGTCPRNNQGPVGQSSAQPDLRENASAHSRGGLD